MPGEEELVKEAVRENILTLSYVIILTNALGYKWYTCNAESNFLY
jgi:hypothetical protein